LLGSLPLAIRQQLQAVAVNGTSGTVLLCDRNGQPLTPPLLYNDSQARAALATVQGIAPPQSPTRSATSSLTKLLWWHQTLPAPVLESARYLLHQADWLGGLLHGRWGVSDYHNALKLGYDVGRLDYPDWLLALPIAAWLPIVVAPGSAIAPILPAIAQQFSLPADCLVIAGTTDSIAAFFASGATSPGEAVTSLGSTLVLKLLSSRRVDDAARGIYSHRLGDLWLVGGASNTGGAVLRHYFSEAQLAKLSQQIQPEQPTNLHYYPLLQPGERFPINDPDYPPRLTPQPQDPVIFLQGLLEGITRIESQGYNLLTQLGATPVHQVYTAGGGAQNLVWQKMRQLQLGIPVTQALHTEAAYGTARLAQGLSLGPADI
jgi:sugar (pentulose or hexulose) kinase